MARTHNILPLIDRFWNKVHKGGQNECWMWLGTPNGRYGVIKVGDGSRSMIGVHRLSYEIHFGVIPDAMQVCHKCDVMKCVNPAHLFLGTSQDNTADKVAKGRQATGERINSKITPDDVRIIRGMWRAGGLTMEEIGSMFGVTDSCIDLVVNRKTWKHLP